MLVWAVKRVAGIVRVLFVGWAEGPPYPHIITPMSLL
jgi:hypothetical protein